jgi:hypothetical protein
MVMQQLKKLSRAAMFGVFLTAQAQAALVDTVTSIPYHNSFSNLSLNSVSNDEFRFDLAGPTAANFVLHLTNMSLTGSNWARLSVYSGSAGGTLVERIYATGTAASSTITSTAPFNLQDGYRAVFYGRVNTTGPTGSYSIDIAPVPEPSEWMMLAGGLALIGAFVRRRKQTQS